VKKLWQRLKMSAFIAVSGIVAIAVVVAGAIFGMNYYYNDSVKPPAPHFRKPRSLGEARRDDLEFLRGFLHADWGYTDATRRQASTLIARAEQSPAPSLAVLTLTAAKVAALADNGHTNIEMASIANHLDRIPVRTCVLHDGLFVVRARPEARALLGDRIVAINGHPIEAVRSVLDGYTGGAPQWRDTRLPLYLETPSLLQSAGLGASDTTETLTVQDRQNASQTVTLKAVAPDPDGTTAAPCDNLRPEAIGKRPAVWTSALAGRSDMLLFQGRPAPFFRTPLLGGRGYYVRFDQNDDDGGVDIQAFTRDTATALVAAKPKFVIVDMRFNSGGDYLLTAGFMRGLPRLLPQANFYVLISPLTFSAAMTSSAFIKYAGGSRAMFVGDLPGDRMRFRAEGGEFCLPYSGICLMARTALHDYTTTDCEPLLQCFLPDRLFPLVINSMKPDVYAPLTFAALTNGRDPAVDAVLAREE